MPERAQTARQALSACRLPGLAAQLTHQISGGERGDILALEAEARDDVSAAIHQVAIFGGRGGRPGTGRSA